MGDGVRVAFEHLDDSVLVDGPVEDQVALLCCDYDGVVVMRVRELLDLVGLHVQLPVALGIGSEVDVETLAVRDVEDLSIVGEVQAGDVPTVVFDYLGWLETLQNIRS